MVFDLIGVSPKGEDREMRESTGWIWLGTNHWAKISKARKEWQCERCKKQIRKGMVYIHYRFLSPFSEYRLCRNCVGDKGTRDLREKWYWQKTAKER